MMNVIKIVQPKRHTSPNGNEMATPTTTTRKNVKMANNKEDETMKTNEKKHVKATMN